MASGCSSLTSRVSTRYLVMLNGICVPKRREDSSNTARCGPLSTYFAFQAMPTTLALHCEKTRGRQRAVVHFQGSLDCSTHRTADRRHHDRLRRSCGWFHKAPSKLLLGCERPGIGGSRPPSFVSDSSVWGSVLNVYYSSLWRVFLRMRGAL